MSRSEQFVDRIVREVLRRLAASDSQPVAEKSNQQSTPTPQHNTTEKTLQIASPLVTLETLAGRLADVERVITLRGAVVTPAVKDLLRHRPGGRHAFQA